IRAAPGWCLAGGPGRDVADLGTAAAVLLHLGISAHERAQLVPIDNLLLEQASRKLVEDGTVRAQDVDGAVVAVDEELADLGVDLARRVLAVLARGAVLLALEERRAVTHVRDRTHALRHSQLRDHAAG